MVRPPRRYFPLIMLAGIGGSLFAPGFLLGDLRMLYLGAMLIGLSVAFFFPLGWASVRECPLNDLDRLRG